MADLGSQNRVGSFILIGGLDGKDSGTCGSDEAEDADGDVGCSAGLLGWALVGGGRNVGGSAGLHGGGRHVTSWCDL